MWTDRGSDMTKLTAAFRNFAQAPKNQSMNAVQGVTGGTDQTSGGCSLC